MIVIAAASSRTHGSDSHTEAPSQPSASAWATANVKVTDTCGAVHLLFRLRLAGTA